MTGRIRPGIYVLGLIRLRTYGNFGVPQLLVRMGFGPRNPGRRTVRAGQSWSGFRSRR